MTDMTDMNGKTDEWKLKDYRQQHSVKEKEKNINVLLLFSKINWCIYRAYSFCLVLKKVPFFLELTFVTLVFVPFKKMKKNKRKTRN